MFWDVGQKHITKRNEEEYTRKIISFQPPALISHFAAAKRFYPKKKILNRSLLWQRAERRYERTDESVWYACICGGVSTMPQKPKTGLHQKSAVISSVNGAHASVSFKWEHPSSFEEIYYLPQFKFVRECNKWTQQQLLQ